MSYAKINRFRCFPKPITRSQRGRTGPPTQGQLIAEMSLGFWMHLLQPKYHHILWRGRLGPSFPNAPSSARPADLQALGTRLLDARNRVAHHEPILWQNPATIYEDCLTLVAWIAGAPAREVIEQAHNHFQTVQAAQPVP